MDLTDKYCDSKFHGKEFYIGDEVSAIDKQIMQLRPLNGLCRLPQKLSGRVN